jgi:N-succinyldiaminopimelate aminotransferase
VATRLLEGKGDAWQAEVREEYRKTGLEASRLLGCPPPEGSTFLFVDTAPVLGPSGLQGFLEGCADDGIFVAPGPSFGPYPTHIRVCYTAAPPDVTLRGIAKLAKRMKLEGGDGGRITPAEYKSAVRK